MDWSLFRRLQRRRPGVIQASLGEVDGVSVEDFARGLDLEVEVGALRSLIARRMQHLSGCQEALFYGLIQRGYMCLYSTERRGSPPSVALNQRAPLTRWLRSNEDALVVSAQRDVVEYLGSDEREFLRSVNVQICLPLIANHELLGILFLTSPGLGWRSATPVPTLIACSLRASLALDHLRWHHAERDRLEAVARAQQLAVAGELAATLAHEVRNPLTAIRSTVQYVIQSTPDWPRKADLLNNVLSDVDRIADTVSGLLRLSRKHDVEMVDLDWVQVLDRTALAVMQHLEGRQVAMERRLETSSLLVRGDAGELGQVLVNVLLNACDACPNGGVIRVRADIESEAGPRASVSRARITVTDTGVGISPEQMGRIFEPFYTTKSTGTGLGLAICWEIMTRHFGTIRVDSQVGTGTTVVLRLPLRSA